VPEAKTSKGPSKILVCDDDKAVSNFLKRFLKKEGYVWVDTALSGEEALEKIAKDKHQLLLLDIKLPGIGGLEVLKRVKEIDNNIAVIMITGFADAENADQAKKMGAYDYIVKPFDLAYLKLVLLTKMVLDS